MNADGLKETTRPRWKRLSYDLDDEDGYSAAEPRRWNKKRRTQGEGTLSRCVSPHRDLTKQEEKAKNRHRTERVTPEEKHRDARQLGRNSK